MAYKYSTGLRNLVVISSGYKEALDGGLIRLYSGTVPASADSALGSATMVLEIKTSEDGNLTFEGTAIDGQLQKSLSEIWRGVVAAGLAPSFFRYIKPSDTGDNSTSQVRIQGTCGGPAADMVTGTAPFNLGDTKTLDQFAIQLPESA